MLRVVFAALLVAGCSSQPRGVEVTIDASQISPAVRGSGTDIDVVVQGDETFEQKVSLTSSLHDTEKLLYVTAVADGNLRFTLYIHDTNNRVIACGTGQIDVHQGRASLQITLTPGECAAGGVTPSTCSNLSSHPEWLFCDGFDGTMLDPLWGVDTTNGEVTIDNMTKTRGNGSARFHMDTAANFEDMGNDYEVARIYRTVSHPGSVFVRAFIDLPASTVTRSVSDTTVIKLVTDFNSGNGAYLTWNAGSQLGVRTVGGSAFDATGGAFSTNGWTCLEWQLPTTNGETHVWLDGNEVTALAGTLSFSGQLVELSIGPDTNVDAGYSADMWVDDLVVSTARVGCN